MYCHECIPHCIGAWDTVGSLGILYGRRNFDDSLHPGVKYAFHAVAIDEERKKFPVNLWDEAKVDASSTVEQVWFPGVHADVGGGYVERGIANATLIWMLRRAQTAGMKLRDGWEQDIPPDPTDKNSQHNSRTGLLWMLLGKKVRPIPEGAHIHQSVFDRKAAGVGYDPKNLPKEFVTDQWEDQAADASK